MTDKTDKKEDKKEDKKKAVAHARSPTVTALETVLTKHFPPELVKIVFDYAREFEGLCVAQLGSGVKGTGNNELHHPLGISSDGRHLFVTDSDNYRVQVFDRNTLAFVRTFGKYGDGDSEFNHPSRAAFLSGEVFISDFFNMRIQVFTTEGKFKRAITMNYNPSTIAAAVGKIYVANYNQSHVTVYSLDGDQLERWTTKLSGPCGLGCDATERKIYCVDRTCCRVFNEEGTELKAFGEKILTNPASVCVDAKHVYVADQMAVKVFKKPGYELVQTIEVAGEKQGSLPALLMTEDSTLFAVDELNQRVQIFQ